MQGATTVRKPLSNQELSDFFGQMALLLRAGLPLPQGVAMLAAELEDLRGKQLFEQVAATLESGQTLHTALEQTGCFAPYSLHMTLMGERSGQLEHIAALLEEYYQREANVAKNIRQAIGYPLVMTAMMLAVITVISVKVLPVFAEVYARLGSEITGVAATAMRFGAAIAGSAWVLPALLLVLGGGYFLLGTSLTAKTAFDRFAANWFATRRLYQKIDTGRFALSLSIALSSGLDTHQALDMCAQLVTADALKARIANCRNAVAQGQSFPDALIESQIFGGIYAAMVSIGFKTGEADSVTRRIAEQIDQQVNDDVAAAVAFVEPTVVALLSIVVGLIMLSVILPLLGVMSAIG